ncbi:N-acetylglucosamine-6-phosphate deacetylase [Consotaella salsifontis]|uniref:N-acetylglucosamine 6-phosphate deacetylase n=1 Tax=Consotaella salsifontis TaxID=1365950 RepID=A0A1T4RAU5_9HYPH|nr:N-acetylglucosamine-6-phosphate deacetylase [Consotaella salsifontis]SKA13160.1 N-acetylglucosamine 6-phosphate deacetylase [Consotaella salsifontis]
MKLERRDDQPRALTVMAGKRLGSFEFLTDGAGRVLKRRPTSVPAEHDAIRTLGLVDIQVNGFGGVDFNSETLTPDDVDAALMAMLAHGATQCLPTIITSSVDVMSRRLRALDAAVAASRLGPWMVRGYHVEGPFLSPEEGYAGCHPKDQMRAGDAGVLDRLADGLVRPIRILTVAPEREGVLELIPQAARRGISVALGHTNAGREVVEAAVAAGARMSTHLGNGIAHLLPKNDNPLFAQLGEDHLFASFIADGIHIPPYMARLYLRAKGAERSVLVTDATAGAAAEPGIYTLGDVEIERCADGVVREPGSPYLGGSSATMEQVVRNVINWLDLTLSEAVDLARLNPLAALDMPAVPDVGHALEFVEWALRPDGPHVVAAGVGPWNLIVDEGQDLI